MCFQEISKLCYWDEVAYMRYNIPFRLSFGSNMVGSRFLVGAVAGEVLAIAFECLAEVWSTPNTFWTSAFGQHGPDQIYAVDHR